MITLDRVCIIAKAGEEPPYSPWGYIVTTDGTAYALTRQYWHGAVLALLFPELLAAYRVEEDWNDDDDWNDNASYKGAPLLMPDEPDDLNVFEFQQFEFSLHGKLDVIRICPTRMTGPCSIDLPENGCTVPQREMLRVVLTKVLGLSLNDEVATDHRDMTVRQCLVHADTGTSVWRS